jgi:hypothetical protein
MSTYESLTSGKWNIYRNPMSSGAISLSATLLVMLATKTISPAIPWQICGASMLFFAVYTQVTGLFLVRWPLYMGLSYLSFIVHTIILLVVAGSIADAPLSVFPQYKKTFVLLSIFFVLLTMIAGVYRLALYLIGDSTPQNKKP